MIPSPVNLSTVPSKRWTASERIEKKPCMIPRHCSGSCCSAMSIEPMTSANSTVTSLRSPSGSICCASSITIASGNRSHVSSYTEP